MTQFKHIIIVVLMLVASGQWAKAQSSSLMPYEGATHTYSWDGIQQGMEFSFFISDNADGTGTYSDDYDGEFKINSTLGLIGADGIASTSIDWRNGAAANIYYLWVEVENSNGCSNKRYVQITPQVNDFDLLTFNNPKDYTESCPATDANGGFNPITGTQYSPGTTTLQFKVTRENGNRAWSFIPKLSVTDDLGLTNYIIEVVGGNSGTIAANGAGRYIVNELDNDVIVTVSIENAPGEDRNVTLEAFDGKVDGINLSDGDNTNNSAVHEIKVMPLIQNMGGV